LLMGTEQPRFYRSRMSLSERQFDGKFWHKKRLKPMLREYPPIDTSHGYE
jgi:hypothetical protein